MLKIEVTDKDIDKFHELELLYEMCKQKIRIKKEAKENNNERNTDN